MTIIIITISLFVALGKLLDSYMYKNEKIVLYNKMQAWINTISNTKTLELHVLMINWTIKQINKIFNFKSRPIKSIIKIILISWVLTSLMNIIGLAHNSCLFNCIPLEYWHDYLPWYPFYIVNFIFDFLTIAITIRILIIIKNKNLVVASLGIISDFIFSSILLIACLLCFSFANSFFLKLSFGSKFVDHQPKNIAKDFQIVNYDKQVLTDLGLNPRIFHTIENEGFSKNAILKIRRSNFYLQYLKEIPKSIAVFFLGKEIYYKQNYDIEVEESNNKMILKTYVLYPLPVFHVSTAMTTFFPLFIYLSILFLAYLSKEISTLGRMFGLRIFKSLIQRSSTEDIFKFNPGIHIGILLSLIIVIIKLISEIIKFYWQEI